MRLPKDYDSVMARSNEIQKKALGMDFDKYESGSVAFDYEGLMKDTGYTIQECIEIEAETAVGNTRDRTEKYHKAFQKICGAGDGSEDICER